MFSQRACCSTALFSVDTFHSVVVFIFCKYARGESSRPTNSPKLQFHFWSEHMKKFGHHYSFFAEAEAALLRVWSSLLTILPPVNVESSDVENKYSKGNEDVSGIFILQPLGTQIGLKS